MVRQSCREKYTQSHLKFCFRCFYDLTVYCEHAVGECNYGEPIAHKQIPHRITFTQILCIFTLNGKNNSTSSCLIGGLG